MIRWLLVAALVIAACAAPVAAQTTLTIDQKIRLTVAARDANGAPVTIADGTPVVWSVEGVPGGSMPGTFESTPAPSLSAYYLPLRAGTHVVRASLTVEGQPFNAQITLTVTAVIPASIVVLPGAIVPK